MTEPRSLQRSAFSNPDFRRLTLSRFLFSFAVQLQAVVVGWQVYEITHDPLNLGLIGLTEAIPALSLALFAGDIVDRHNPLVIYRGVISVSLISALILLGVSSGPMGSMGWLPRIGGGPLFWIYAAALITGLARGFSQPSLYSLIPQLVSRAALQASSAWITSAFQVAAVSGPALGGLLYAWSGGPRFAYLVDSLMLAFALAALFGFETRPKIHPRPAESESLGRRLASGVRYVFHHELLLSALALDMFAVLFGGVTAILPVFAAEILHIGPMGLGFLRASPSVGAIFMGIFLIRRPIGRHAGRILLGAVAGFGLCMLGFALSREFWLSALFLGLSGALDSASMVIRGTIVQLSSPDAMRGRIASVNSIFIGSSNEIGAFESGLAAKLLGTVPSVIFGGSVTLLTVIVAALAAPRLRKMDLRQL